MKKIAIIAAWSILVLINVWQVYDAGKYYSKNFSDLIYVFAIAFTGGIAFWMYSRFSPAVQHKFQLALLSAMAIMMSVLGVLFLLIIVWELQFFPRGVPLEHNSAITLAELGFISVVGPYRCWWEFYRVLKKRRKDSGTKIL